MSQESNTQIEDFLNWKALGNWTEASPLNKLFTAHNPLCGDQVTLNCIEVNGEMNIESMRAEACSVCMASAGILYHLKKHWNSESLNLYQTKIDNFLNDNGILEEFTSEEVKFWTIMRSHPGRHRCAFLPYIALKKAF